MSLDHFPPNPDYGRGCFRRVVTIRRSARAVLASIDDTHHAMWVLIEHDGDVVTSIDGDVTRGPSTTCGKSSAALAALVGRSLDEAFGRAVLSPAANCTHLADLAAWGIRAVGTGSPMLTRYEISVPDEVDRPVWTSISRNGVTIHRWLIRDHRVSEPEALSGRPLMRGFAAWAREEFSGDDFEAAVMLQRGIFVARGRTRLVDRSPPVPLRMAVDMKDACFSYSGDQFATATSVIGYVRDFTDHVLEAPPPAHAIALLKGTHE
ncbi:MAG TPA: DUF2889 domain-containing protein [Sphingomonas sp.]